LECPARHEDALHRSGWSGAISPQPNVWLLQTISHRHRSPALNGVQTEYTGKTRWSKNTSKINYWRTHPQILPLRPSLSRNLRLIRIEADQAYTADRHRPVTTEHGRLHERSRLVAPHFHNAFLCVHTTSPSEFSVHTGRIGALLRRLEWRGLSRHLRRRPGRPPLIGCKHRGRFRGPRCALKIKCWTPPNALAAAAARTLLLLLLLLRLGLRDLRDQFLGDGVAEGIEVSFEDDSAPLGTPPGLPAPGC
jgi:hypothetical protein